MGEVYRSHDSALHRNVAIKILPELFALDPDRLARFSREAQTLAALSHPNVAHIYGLVDAPLGTGHVHALVMEWVDGEDLAERISRGPIPVDDALPLAKQVAEALEAAHEHGIVHRDVKPANIKIKTDGTVKMLDFGLAKAGDPAAALFGSNPIGSPTMTSPALTAMGIILGTAAYMAPEQARGKPVDRRTDIWAFGVVLLEMLTGRRLFDGDTVSDAMVSVLTGPIDLSGLPPNVPHRVREMILRCLERDPKRRLRDIGEARIALESAAVDVTTSAPREGGPTTATSAANRVRPRRGPLPWSIGIASLAIAGVMTAAWIRGENASRAGDRLMLEIGPPWGEELLVQSNAGAAVISPDGSMVVFIGQGRTGRRLYIRSMMTGEARAISGTEEASYPFWSPDSRSLAFFGSSKLLTVSIAGGLPEAIADIEQGRGGTWTSDGTILFTPTGGGVIHRVAARGGPTEPVTTLDASRNENAHYWPVALPDGRSFLFFVRSTRPENNGIYLGSLESKTAPVRLVTSLSSGLYAAGHDGGPGHVLWVRDGELLAQPLDIAAARLTGDVTTIASDVRVEESQRGTFASVSATGTLVWASAKAADVEMAWFSRDGRKLETLPIAPGKVMQPQLSPDGGRLLFTRAANGTADVWLLDFASGVITQMTTDPGYDENPSWASDGRSFSYGGRAGDQTGLLIMPVDRSAPPRSVGTVELSEGEFLRNTRYLVVPRPAKDGVNVALVRQDRADAVEDLTTDPGIRRTADALA